MSESKYKGGLWARLFGAFNESEEAPAQQEPPVAEPAPVAHPVASVAVAIAELAPIAHPVALSASVAVAEPATVAEAAPPVEEAPTLVETPQPCQACGAPRKDLLAYCHDCGWLFPAAGAAAPLAASSALTSRENPMTAITNGRLQNRYELGDLVGERQGVARYRGVDHSSGLGVVIVAAPLAAPALPVAEAAPVAGADDIVPGFDEDLPAALALGGPDAWPSIAWERNLLERADHPSLPKVLDQFTENDKEYLVLEYPLGISLWDAWDDPEHGAATRYRWLQFVAGCLEALHNAGAIFEGIRPDVIVVGESGPRITDISDVLPIPLPAGAPIKATLYTAPELIVSPTAADTRSDLYSFGAMLYSLEYLHHPLEAKDFERPYTPLQITERFPDVHPLFLRLINKTFCRDLHTRFPTDELTKTDQSGFQELIKTLGVCGKAFDEVRLDIAAWTTTGMVRTGNEDALTVLHGVDTRLDELTEYAMVLLCDGMGGYDAGEVAAALTINEMRKYLLDQPIFAALTGKEGPTDAVDPKKYQEVLRDALKHANREVYTAARTPGKGKRGMGCTAECVYIDSRNVIAGHVGDSRVYHLHRGRLVQLTRDQTLVNRLVELGQLTAEEAEDHPRKNELQQAIGGQPDVVPGLYAGKLMRGDWVLVCSDGLTNHISNKELETMLTREAANSAEEAARRLLNLVNLRGATDNATIVVVRAS